MEALFLRILVTAGVTAPPMLVLLFPARRWLERRYAPQVRWTLWLGLAVLLLMGVWFSGAAATPATVLDAPSYQITLPAWNRAQAALPMSSPMAGAAPEQAEAEASSPAAPSAAAPEASSSPSLPLPALAGYLWLAIAAAILLRQLVRYKLARRKLLNRSTPVPPPAFCPAHVELRQLSGLTSPITLGVLRPVVFLPAAGADPLALRHELTHIQRRDLPCKALLFLSCALYWFDPLVWRMAAIADRDMEAACDAQVVRNMTPAEKRVYGELLLTSALRQSAPPLSSRFGGSKAQMKSRLTQLFHPGRRSWGLVAVLLAAVCLGTGLVACRSRQTGQAPSRETVYENEALGYTLRLPNGWADQWTAETTRDGALTTFYRTDLRQSDNPTAGVIMDLAVCSPRDFYALYGDKDLYELPRGGGPHIIPLGLWGDQLAYLHIDPWEADSPVGSMREQAAALSGADFSAASLSGTTGGRDYADPDYHWTLHLPDNWAGQYWVSRREEEDGVYWRFYHLQSWLAGYGQGENWGLLLTIRTEPGSFMAPPFTSLAENGLSGPLASGNGLSYYIYYPTDVTWLPETAQLYQALEVGIDQLGAEDFALTQTALPQLAPTTTTQPAPPSEAEPAARAAYAAVLRNLLEHHILPDGTQLSEDDIFQEDLSLNTFAVADVDLDGREELILFFTTIYIAGMQGCVLDYDASTGQTYLELTASPGLSFYPGGYVKAAATHNQTNGALWPYQLYQYQPETDTYQALYLVYSCDRESLERLGRGEEYPQAADKSGAGIVYYVNGTVPVDQEDYLTWARSWTGGGEPLTLDELPLTAENIASLVS